MIFEKSFNMLSKMLEGSYVKYIQFKSLHNRIVTNPKLHAMNLRDDDMCYFCEASPEIIYHAFTTCPRTTELWHKIEVWLCEKTNNNVKISGIEKIFGGDKRN